MGGVILGKSTSEESEKLSLAIYALSEVATKKLKSKGIILLEDDLDVFCNLILSRDEEKQIQLIHDTLEYIRDSNSELRQSGRYWKKQFQNKGKKK